MGLVGFRYDDALLRRYPNVVAGVTVARGLHNPPSSEALLRRYEAEQAQVRENLAGRSLGDLPSIAAWRSAFRAFGVEPTQYRCSAEALLRRLSKGDSLPSVSSLVDLGNLVSIRHALPVAVMDARAAEGWVTVGFAKGDEIFIELGSEENNPPKAGEVIFYDERGQALARRWCWRQSAECAARADTCHVLIVIEAQHAEGKNAVRAAQGDLINLLNTYCGGDTVAGTVDLWRPKMPPR